MTPTDTAIETPAEAIEARPVSGETGAADFHAARAAALEERTVLRAVRRRRLIVDLPADSALELTRQARAATKEGRTAADHAAILLHRAIDAARN